MIALSVFSTILIMATVILIQIGSLYSKGVNAANLQNTNRTIAADVTAALQFSGNVPSPTTPSPCPASAITCYAPSVPSYPTDPRNVGSGAGQMQVYAFCVDKVRYSYALNRELGTDQGTSPQAVTPHVLWRDIMTSKNDPCVPLDLSQTDPSSGGAYNSTGGYEMASNHMRLTRFKVQQASSTSNIYNVNVWMAYGDSDLVQTQGSGGSTPGHSICNGGSGTQFCSVSQISTTVTGRVY